MTVNRRAMAIMTLAGSMLAPRTQARPRPDVHAAQIPPCPEVRGRVGSASWEGAIWEVSDSLRIQASIRDSFVFLDATSTRYTVFLDHSVMSGAPVPYQSGSLRLEVDGSRRTELSGNRDRVPMSVSIDGRLVRAEQNGIINALSGEVLTAIYAGRPLSARVGHEGSRGQTLAVVFPNAALARERCLLALEAPLQQYHAGQCSADLPATPTTPTAPCYLTTAAVECVGLADDCWELRSLRRYRDSVLVRTVEGRALIQHYRAIAPGIVGRVSARPDAAHIWLETYVFCILPAAISARLGLNGVARWLYVTGTRRLHAETLGGRAVATSAPWSEM